MGVGDERGVVRDSQGPAVRDDFRGDGGGSAGRRGGEVLDGSGRAEGADRRVRGEGQLLADGRDGAVRAVLGDFLRHGAGGRGDAGRGSSRLAHDDARYVEIWNLVFMQFDRSAVVDAAGKTAGYKLAPLPKPSIDTGMGLERVAAVLQGVVSNFETDLFTPLIARRGSVRESASRSQQSAESRAGGDVGVQNASLRIIADHARAATFLINDGVVPSNEGRGYVLRKILRRAIRHGRLLGQEKPFLFEMVFAVRDLMKGAYPELVDSAERVAKVVEAEERQFDRVLKIGLTRLDEDFDLISRELSDIWARPASRIAVDTTGSMIYMT